MPGPAHVYLIPEAFDNRTGIHQSVSLAYRSATATGMSRPRVMDWPTEGRHVPAQGSRCPTHGIGTMPVRPGPVYQLVSPQRAPTGRPAECIPQVGQCVAGGIEIG